MPTQVVASQSTVPQAVLLRVPVVALLRDAVKAGTASAALLRLWTLCEVVVANREEPCISSPRRLLFSLSEQASGRADE